jgi:hypothetical protein
MRRLGWFVAGAAAGAGAMRMARRRVRSAVRQLSPRNVRDRVEQGVRSKVDEVGDAIREGRAAKANREPVDAGRVIVLRDRADASRGG